MSFGNHINLDLYIINNHPYYNKKILSMTIDDIKKLIASDESQTLELKKTTSELKKEITRSVHSLIQKEVG